LGRLARKLTRRIAGAALVGETAETLKRLVMVHSKGASTPLFQICPTMHHAVDWCYYHSKPGEVILLSPGCASFGMFRNYVERADAFRKAVGMIAKPVS
jgi:UDP-N-acetylmuramoylalanine--D-glutamate ligase